MDALEAKLLLTDFLVDYMKLQLSLRAGTLEDDEYSERIERLVDAYAEKVVQWSGSDSRGGAGCAT